MAKKPNPFAPGGTANPKPGTAPAKPGDTPAKPKPKPKAKPTDMY